MAHLATVRCSAALISTLLLLVASACTARKAPASPLEGADFTPVATSDLPPVKERRLISDPGDYWWPLNISDYEIIILGKVVASQLAEPEVIPEPEAAPTYPAGPDPSLPSWHPKAQITPDLNATPVPYEPPPKTIHSVEVVISFKPSSLSPGDLLRVRQEGGVRGDILYELEVDPLLQVGETYLLFLRSSDDDSAIGPPFGRLLVDECGTLQLLYRPTVADFLVNLAGHYLTDVTEEARMIYEGFGPTGPPRILVEGQPIPPYQSPYESMETLVGWHEAIFVARVNDASLRYWESQPNTWDELYPSVVTEVLIPSQLAPGEEITLAQSSSDDYRRIPLDVGATYLFFVDRVVAGRNIYFGFATYLIDECGRLQNLWQPEPNYELEALIGMTLEEATVKIQAAIAAMPTPLPPTPTPAVTPAPAPTTTPAPASSPAPTPAAMPSPAPTPSAQ